MRFQFLEGAGLNSSWYTQDESLGVLLPICLAIQFLANSVRLILLQKNMWNQVRCVCH